jgi:hypothetical protein
MEENTEIKSLGEALPEEIARVSEIIKMYESIGPPGMFAAAMMKGSIKMAVSALANGDVVAMIRCYQDLKQYELS